ncbi:MAG: squalene/phytoene synthase family protein [Akkermansia sp.]|nr:squalene/phytoene synthase family protein [Akkermansia sp.]
MDFALLKAVSRSFYLSMVWLPPAMRRGIALGYMLARATDSVADTSTAAPGKRAEVLRQMRRAVLGDLPADEQEALLRLLRGEMAEAQTKESEATLLRRFGECLEELAQVSEVERLLLRRVLSRIVKGQLWDLSYFDEHKVVESAGETLRYTYLVAGCVGEFWTDLGLATMGAEFCPPERRDIMAQAAVRYGQGLQLVNILRDLDEDAARGRVYLSPYRERGKTMCPCTTPEVWHSRAYWFLWDGLDYARRLGTFRLRFTAMLPALLGQKTLRLIKQRTGSERVKISRWTVYATLLEAARLSAWRRAS